MNGNSSATLPTLLSQRLGGDWTLAGNAAGSAFCDTWVAECRDRSATWGRVFVKTLPSRRAAVLEAEADGLAALAATATIRVPALAGCWVDPACDLAVLALEWLAFAPGVDRAWGERLGRQLAALHRAEPPLGRACFGWRRDNWIGGTPQRNRPSADDGVAGWVEFFGSERLDAMVEKLAAAGAPAPLLAAVCRLVSELPRFFDDGHVPRPSLIHGDLWSGNWAALADGSPVVFDPAVSVSDAEAELAMMELFGAPPAGFWPAYREAFGLHPGYPKRRALYQLYHLLNHALLFGGGYARQSLSIAEQLLRR